MKKMEIGKERGDKINPDPLIRFFKI